MASETPRPPRGWLSPLEAIILLVLACMALALFFGRVLHSAS
ncbi:MAG TPA: hypothetical protein VFK09_02265 [Gemmatimonadales bacterium]|jgi:hypothetical protein|nr:hypothetical protein [Gemmatimonadales bacterium]